MSAASVLFSLCDVSVEADGVSVLKNVSWKVQQSERWAVLGPTGSGKSVLAQVLTGERTVSGGKVIRAFAEDQRPTEEEVVLFSAEAYRELAEDTSPFYQARWNSFTEEESPTVSYFLSRQAIHGVSAFHILTADEVPRGFHRRRREVIDLLGLRPLLRRKLIDLSTGEMRKVLLARALCLQPRLLILDDPLAGLDVATQRSFRRVLRYGLHSGTCILLLTAREDDLPPDITHILELDRGRVVFAGRREDAPAKRREPPAKSTARPPSQEPGKVLVNVQDLTIRYGRKRVLDEVNWTVRAGEHWAVLGPNGSGKTTLLSVILADNPQSYANQVVLFGQQRGSGESIWEIKQRIGHVASELVNHTPSGDSVWETVCSGFFDTLGLFRRCSKGQRETAKRWMRRLGLLRLQERPFGSLSAGEQRLVVLARALVKEPQLLLLDEPCEGLDAPFRRRILDLLDSVVCRGRATMVYVTHRPGELPASVGRVLKLRAGRARRSALHSSPKSTTMSLEHAP